MAKISDGRRQIRNLGIDIRDLGIDVLLPRLQISERGGVPLQSRPDLSRVKPRCRRPACPPPWLASEPGSRTGDAEGSRAGDLGRRQWWRRREFERISTHWSLP